jgi:hypothetical protein
MLKIIFILLMPIACFADTLYTDGTIAATQAQVDAYSAELLSARVVEGSQRLADRIGATYVDTTQLSSGSWASLDADRDDSSYVRIILNITGKAGISRSILFGAREEFLNDGSIAVSTDTLRSAEHNATAGLARLLAVLNAGL